MDIARSNIVKSIAGRDAGSLFFVLATEGDFLLLADGRRRRVESPKRKRRKHVELVQEEIASQDMRAEFSGKTLSVNCEKGQIVSK